ncbi:MAG: PSD1 and planctomycete cytochrome C domain-containing protein [Actinomycetota bacterium]
MSRTGAGIAAAAALIGVAAFAAGAAPAPAVKPKAPAPKPQAAAPADPARFFSDEVRPILQDKCIACHSGEKPQGDLRLTSRAALLKGGAEGPAVDLKKHAASLLVTAINYQGRRMPPQGKMSPKQIEVLTRWVAMGAPWPDGEHASLEPKGNHGPPPVNAETMKFWAFQPVKRPAIPKVKNAAWARNPIDAFVLQRLEKAGLQPNSPASRAALIRRGYYDLIGLPPTAEDVEAFVADRSPNAWEKVVDKLLASPQYGEKWGRHWLDLVRYAESNSYERDGTKPNAWRYRDYVIRSFNEDKPYDQFVTEQLAGDEIAPRTPERLIATGYYRLGIWDDEPVDHTQALYDDLDDIVSTTGQVFLGMTIGCARCHDHKLDPIPQKDYYQFLAFFSGLQRYGQRSDESVAAASLRPIAPEDEIRKQQAEIAVHRDKVKANNDKIGALERRVFPDLTPVEKEEWANENARFDIVSKRTPAILTRDEVSSYRTLMDERRRLRRFRPSALDSALCVKEVGPKPRETFVLLRGNPHVHGDPVQPAFPAVLAPPAPAITQPAFNDTSGRRLALAKWIASRENPLTARVMVNRVWQNHFGQGIVRSTSNFGFQGDKPTHPELLDWLAAAFASTSQSGNGSTNPASNRTSVDPLSPSLIGHNGFGWKLKPLHRLIMLSNTYQMSSQASAKSLAKDPENELLWRVTMRRLQAEEIRDAILAVNGTLNPKMYGPSFYPDMPAEVLAGQSRPGENWGKSSIEEQRRRSVYIFVKRSLAVPIIAGFDGPETDFSCSARFATTQPTQALGMLNSEWINDQAKVFAEFLKQKAGDKTEDRVRLCLRRTLQRAPTAAEVTRGVKLIDNLQKNEQFTPDAALASYCLVALNLNEFIYLD